MAAALLALLLAASQTVLPPPSVLDNLGSESITGGAGTSYYHDNESTGNIQEFSVTAHDDNYMESMTADDVQQSTVTVHDGHGKPYTVYIQDGHENETTIDGDLQEFSETTHDNHHKESMAADDLKQSSVTVHDAHDEVSTVNIAHGHDKESTIDIELQESNVTAQDDHHEGSMVSDDLAVSIATALDDQYKKFTVNISDDNEKESKIVGESQAYTVAGNDDHYKESVVADDLQESTVTGNLQKSTATVQDAHYKEYTATDDLQESTVTTQDEYYRNSIVNTADGHEKESTIDDDLQESFVTTQVDRDRDTTLDERASVTVLDDHDKETALTTLGYHFKESTALDNRLETTTVARQDVSMVVDDDHLQHEPTVTRNDKETTTADGQQETTTTTTTVIVDAAHDEELDTPNRSALLSRFRRLYPLHLWSQHGFFTDDFLELVDTLWLQHPPQSPLAHYSLAGAYSAIMVAGVSGNALVIYMFIRCRSLRTPANVLVMNLAVSDLFLLLNLVLFIYNSVYMGPALGVAGCQVYGFVGGLTGTVSIATLTLIAVDRYRVIVHPLRHRGDAPRWRARSWVLASWLYGALFSVPPLLGAAWAGRYVPEGFLTSCSFDYLHRGRRLYVLVFCAAAWLLPLALIAYCYGAICRSAICGPTAAGDEASKQRRNRDNHSTELRLAAVVAGVVALWFVSWTPYAVVALLGALGRQRWLSPTASMLPALFCKTASCVDPFVYAVTHPRFRLELARLLRRPRGLQRRPPPPAATATASLRASLTSEVDVEEVVVMVDMRRLSRDSATLLHGASVAPLPFPEHGPTKPPSWFVPPKPKRNRASSLRRSSTPD